MALTRKDYERAARLVRERFSVPTSSFAKTRFVVIEAFASFFAEDNPRFDARRFREACEVRNEEVES